MNIIREIREVVNGTISIDMPKHLLHRKVEIIVIPLDDISGEANVHERKAWPPDFIEKTAGCMANAPIRRPPQGEYEDREDIV